MEIDIMAIKKLRFPLEMENGAEARTLDELREHFSMERVLRYYSDGRLIKWLRNNYLDEEAEAISELDLKDPELNKKICGIFNVEYNESAKVNIEEVTANKQRLTRLKDFTSEKYFVDVIESIAFDQGELEELLQQGVKEVYLCGDRFIIPLDREGISYIGVNEPTVVIDSAESVDFKAKNIDFQNTKFNEEYLNTVAEEKLNADFFGSAGEWIEPVIKECVKCCSVGHTDEIIKKQIIRKYSAKGYVHYSMVISDFQYDYDKKVYKTYSGAYYKYIRRNLVTVIKDNLTYLKKFTKLSKSELSSVDSNNDPNRLSRLVMYSGLFLFNIIETESARNVVGRKSYDYKKTKRNRLFFDNYDFFKEEYIRQNFYYHWSTIIGVLVPEEINKKIVSWGTEKIFVETFKVDSPKKCDGYILPFDHIRDILLNEDTILVIEDGSMRYGCQLKGNLHECCLFRDTVTNNYWFTNDVNGGPLRNLSKNEEKDEETEDEYYDEYYEGYCPECGEWIEFDEDMIDEDGCVVCPNCEEEFDVDDFDNEAE